MNPLECKLGQYYARNMLTIKPPNHFYQLRGVFLVSNLILFCLLVMQKDVSLNDFTVTAIAPPTRNKK